MVQLEIGFYGHETQIKSFSVKKTYLKLVCYLHHHQPIFDDSNKLRYALFLKIFRRFPLLMLRLNLLISIRVDGKYKFLKTKKKSSVKIKISFLKT